MARCGSGSARSTRASTSASRPSGSRATSTPTRVRYQGNWIPHALRDATEDGVFFVGDSAGHCLPLTAEGIRTALYFGLACGRELAAVLDGRAVPRAARSSATTRSRASHARPFRWMLRVQRLIPRVAPRVLGGSLRAIERKRFIDWAFGHYLRVAHPDFVTAARRPRPRDAQRHARRTPSYAQLSVARSTTR